MAMPAKKREESGQPLKKHGAKAVKQQLADIQKRLSMDIGALLVLFSEGSLQQAELAKQKAKATFLKHGAEMQKLAQEMGGECPLAVEQYLDSIDAIVHAPKGAGGWLDEAKITHCYKMTEKLQKLL